jgi:hypothetical protein
MITIWKKINEESWQLVEELDEELNLSQRLSQLRQDESEYRAEKNDGGFATVLGE